MIETWAPTFLFRVLFGLSMDYHVFLMGRIREHDDLTHDNRLAVASELQATARIITGAALIMVIVFAGIASGQLVAFQPMGFGLAIAVVLDATLARSAPAPAVMTLLGDTNWWLPHWLTWLPDLRIEGAPAQLESPDTIIGGWASTALRRPLALKIHFSKKARRCAVQWVSPSSFETSQHPAELFHKFLANTLMRTLDGPQIR